MEHTTRENLRRVGKKIGPIRLAISALILLLAGFVWMLFIRGTLRAMEVGSGSMRPTIVEGDRLFVLYITPSIVERGELVVIKSPDDEGADMVKRVVALPGDSISYRGGEFYLNGNPSPPPGQSSSTDGGTASFALTLGPDQYYVLGDNRANSHDSKQFGPISKELIRGTVLYRYAPRSRMGTVE